MTCNKCGKELEENVKVCDSCGEAVTETTKPKKKNKKLIAIIAAVVAVLVFVIALGSGDDNSQENIDSQKNNSVSTLEDVKVEKNGNNYVFDITYEDFCKEIAEVVAVMFGGDEVSFVDYCNDILPVERTVEYYSGNLNMYTVGLESSEYSSGVMVLKAEVYVEPETNKVVCVSVFKANGSSTIDNFNALANKASLILSGKTVADMEENLIKTVDESWMQTHYFKNDDCGLKFEQQKNNAGGGDMRRLTIYPAETLEITE